MFFQEVPVFRALSEYLVSVELPRAEAGMRLADEDLAEKVRCIRKMRLSLLPPQAYSPR